VRRHPDGRRRPVTPHTEGFCAVVWHLLVSHPRSRSPKTKWEIGEVTGAAAEARRDPRSRRHLIDVVRDEETGAISSAFHPDQLRLLRARRRAARAAGRGLRARDRDQPAGAGEGAVLGRAVKRTNDALVAAARERGSHRAVEVCMHHPEGGPGATPRSSGRATAGSRKRGCWSTRSSRASSALDRATVVDDRRQRGDVEAGAPRGCGRGSCSRRTAASCARCGTVPVASAQTPTARHCATWRARSCRHA
jgi:hypothetical protein